MFSGSRGVGLGFRAYGFWDFGPSGVRQVGVLSFGLSQRTSENFGNVSTFRIITVVIGFRV